MVVTTVIGGGSGEIICASHALSAHQQFKP
jgi:hypothetical protein